MYTNYTLFSIKTEYVNENTGIKRFRILLSSEVFYSGPHSGNINGRKPVLPLRKGRHPESLCAGFLRRKNPAVPARSFRIHAGSDRRNRGSRQMMFCGKPDGRQIQTFGLRFRSQWRRSRE